MWNIVLSRFFGMAPFLKRPDIVFFRSGALETVQPLWGYPKLDPQVWEHHGIRTLTDIMPEGVLLTFHQLSQLF